MVVAASCHSRSEQEPTSFRYEAVKAAAGASSGWCDTRASAAPRLTLPLLAPPPVGHGQPSLARGKRAWVNLWATWCQPCLREIPLLLKWQGELRKDGLDVDVVLLSIDEDASELDRFLAGRKDLQAVKVGRVHDLTDYQRWVKAFVQDSATPIPIHLLSSADGEVRCVRTGSLHEGDYPAARSALR
jgi:thiol-disulfide isomerase/thioredoxin